jgi:Ni/Co efflux regulator RcnB
MLAARPSTRKNTMHSLSKLGASLLLVLAAVAMPAIARDGGRGYDRDDRRGHHDRDRDYDHRDYGRRDDRRWDDDRRGRGHGYAYGHDRYRHDNRRYYYPAPRWHAPAYRTGYYYAPPPRWVRGGRIYGPGYGPTYVVTDYRGYGLRYPPHGYGWRRDDHGHFLLVALATGVIADLVFHGGH